ncbi:unnamed protein product [Euphydryas editha]|uniref:Endonuclease/exonuclease/phosphatase domain-containing protein n=1 Tax=Euphydryas editha TaxID=104508 RepID=A0AAU9U6D8_EUPED|nr:unnamed protein product [Euphydryas editha]
MTRLDILQWNINGFYRRKQRLKILLTERNPSCICLQETNFKNNCCQKLSGYEAIFKNRNNSLHASGGVVSYIKSNIFVSKVSLNTNLEAVAGIINYPTNITLCNIYLPNSTVLNKEDLIDLIEQLPKPFLLVGDFNSHSLTWGCTKTDSRGKILLEILDAYADITILNENQPTYFNVSNASTSAIDLALSSCIIAPLFQWSVLDNPHDSDHYPIIITHSSPTLQDNPNVTKWIFQKANWELFKSLIDIGIRDLSDISTDSVTTIDQNLLQFNNLILNSANLAIPKSRGTRDKKKKLPWLTNECIIAIKNYKKAFRKYLKYKTIDHMVDYKRSLVLCARSEDANEKVETLNKDKRQTEEGAPHLVYRTARKQEQVAPVEENQEEDKGPRGDPQEYRPGQVFSLNVQELLELQPERKAPLSSNQQLQQLYNNPQQEQRQNIQQFYYLEPQLSRQVALQPSHAVIARPHYSSNGGEASVGAALAVSDTSNSAESLDRQLLALLGHQLRQDDSRPQTFTQIQQTPQPQQSQLSTLQAQNVAPQYQQVDVPYVPKPSKKPTKLRPKAQITPSPTSAAPQQYLIETTNIQQQQHQEQQQFRPVSQNQRVPQTLRYVSIQSAPTALQQTLYERPESQGLKIVPAPKLQQLNPQYNYRIQYQQEASPKQFRIIDSSRPQANRQEQSRLLTSNERPITYLKRFPEPEKLRAIPISDQTAHEGSPTVQRPTQVADQYYLRPLYRSNEQRSRYELTPLAFRPMEQSRSTEVVKAPLSAIYVSKNITPKKVLRPLVRVDPPLKLEQPQREQAYRIEQQQQQQYQQQQQQQQYQQQQHQQQQQQQYQQQQQQQQQYLGTEQVSIEQQAQSLEDQRAHLPPPRNSKAYTPEEFSALVAAGYSVTPIPVGNSNEQIAESRSASEAITIQQRRPVYSRRYQYLPLSGDDAP